MTKEEITARCEPLKKSYQSLNVEIPKFEECLLLEEREEYFLTTLFEVVDRDRNDMDLLKDLRRKSKNLKFFNGFESDLLI